MDGTMVELAEETTSELRRVEITQSERSQSNKTEHSLWDLGTPKHT